MIGRRKRIQDLTIKIKNLTSLSEYKTREIGELVSTTNIGEPESAQFSRLYDSIIEIRKSIPEKNREAAKIKKIVAARESVKQDIDQIRKDIAIKEKEARDSYEKIGKIAYGIYKLHPKQLTQYEGFFVTLQRLDEKGEGYLPKNDSEYRMNKTVIIQLAGAIKSIYASYVSRSNLARYAKAYREAGIRVAGSNFGKDAGDKALDDLLAVLERIRKENSALEQKAESTDEKQEKLKADLAELGVKGSPVLRIRELSGQRKKLEILLASDYEAIGNLFIDNPHILPSAGPQVIKLLEELRELQKEAELARAEIKRLEAEIEIDSIREKIEKSSSRIEQLTRTIQKCEEGINVQKERISELEREKEKYEKIAGAS